MRSAIDPSDRKLLLIAGAVMLVLAAALAIVSPPPAEQGAGTPSIYSDASGGAHAAFLLLQKLHRNLHAWERSPTDLPQDPADAILILANPEENPSRAEKEALLQFAEMGGRIIFTGPRVGDFFPNAGSSDVPAARPWATYQANLPSSYTRQAATISLQKQSEWEGNNPSAFALYGDADSPVVMMWSVGDGVILWWAGPTPLTNAGITQEGNLNFFLDAVSDPLVRANQQPEIYWDEYFHGQRATLWAYFQKTPVPWGLLQFGVLGLAVLFTFSRRSGPMMMPAVATRLAPLEFVDTLGGLYQRAHAEPAVVAAVYRRFRGTLTRHLRLPMTTPNALLDEAARGGLGLKDDSFLEALQRADSASRAQKIPPPEALELIRKLENYEEQLGLKKKETGETLTVENLARLATHVRGEFSKVIVGQRTIVDQLLLVLVCGGHALMEGVPGVGKTLAVKTIARICGLAFQRVQCTADLMPADVIGTNVFNLATSTFSLHQGPLFTDLLLVDEINRTSPRTQAALLESMEERQVTIDRTRYALSEFFTVFATQNPIEFEGTYPLPEAQLDRFLLKIRIGYPSEKEEIEILSRFEQGFDPRRLDEIPIAPLEPGLLAAARRDVTKIRVESTLYSYIATLARRSRDWPALSLGASPRAAIGLFTAARAFAGMEGRDFLIPDDIKAVVPAVLRHRVLLKPEADLEGLTSDQVLTELLATVEVPK